METRGAGMSMKMKLEFLIAVVMVFSLSVAAWLNRDPIPEPVAIAERELQVVYSSRDHHGRELCRIVQHQDGIEVVIHDVAAGENYCEEELIDWFFRHRDK